MAGKPKTTKVSAKRIAEHRVTSKKDTSPSWQGQEDMTVGEFTLYFHNAMAFYRTGFSSRDLKPKVIDWMSRNSYSKSDITTFKNTKDWRCSVTTGAIAANLLRGMPAVKHGFNQSKNTEAWLRDEIASIIEDGKEDIREQEEAEAKVVGPQITIQERMQDTSLGMTEEIEQAIENWHKDADSFEPKAFKVLNMLKGKKAKAGHARVIRDFYAGDLAELELLASGKADEQLKEGYSNRSRKHIRKLIDFLKEVNEACTMLMQEAKVTRKPRAKKPTDKAKAVSRLKYKKTDEPLKLVSIDPQDIIGAKELWTYNTKYRKLGKYVSADFSDLGVKGTSITGYDETKSVQKTLRKPEEQLKAFRAAGKVALRKFLEEINSVDAKMNGRIGEETLLLKVM
jgi:hypothetical protein